MNIQQILGYLLNTSAKLIKKTMDNNLRKYNITTSQWAVLKLLYTKYELTQTQIANELLSDKATVGEVIGRLCEKNYVKKLVNKNDKRAYVASLTLEAKNIVEDIDRMATEVTKKALEGFNKGDIQVLYKSLNKIINNLSKE